MRVPIVRKEKNEARKPGYFYLDSPPQENGCPCSLQCVSSTVPRKVKRQYLLALQVKRYCLLVLQGNTAAWHFRLVSGRYYIRLPDYGPTTLTRLQAEDSPEFETVSKNEETVIGLLGQFFLLASIPCLW